MYIVNVAYVQCRLYVWLKTVRDSKTFLFRSNIILPAPGLSLELWLDHDNDPA